MQNAAGTGDTGLEENGQEKTPPPGHILYVNRKEGYHTLALFGGRGIFRISELFTRSFRDYSNANRDDFPDVRDRFLLLHDGR